MTLSDAKKAGKGKKGQKQKDSKEEETVGDKQN